LQGIYIIFYTMHLLNVLNITDGLFLERNILILAKSLNEDLEMGSKSFKFMKESRNIQRYR